MTVTKRDPWTGRTRHGTQSGWRLHQELGERPCDPCWFAKSEYDKERLKATDKQIANRQRAQAQQRAMSELTRRHPEEYRKLYETFKAKIMVET